VTRRVLTRYTVRSARIMVPHRLAVVTDLHDTPWEDLIPQFAEAEAVLIVGDMINRHKEDAWHNAVDFLNAARAVKPVYYSLGNHERRASFAEIYREHVPATGVTVLDHEICRIAPDLVLGGLSSQPCDERFDASVVTRLAQESGFRLLMCHHPEYYDDHVKPWSIDLTLSGHAHGGQIRLFGRGLYAPGQGLLPRYTSGFYDGRRLLVGRGLANTQLPAPRICNPCELIMLDLLPEEDDHVAP